MHLPPAAHWIPLAALPGPGIHASLESTKHSSRRAITKRAKTDPIAKSPHVILRQLLALHQSLDPAIQRRDGTRVRRRREAVWLWRSRRIDLHVIFHCCNGNETIWLRLVRGHANTSRDLRGKKRGADRRAGAGLEYGVIFKNTQKETPLPTRPNDSCCSENQSRLYSRGKRRRRRWRAIESP